MTKYRKDYDFNLQTSDENEVHGHVSIHVDQRGVSVTPEKGAQLSLTHEEFDRLNAVRQEYLAKAKAAQIGGDE